MKTLKVLAVAALGATLLAGCFHLPTGGAKYGYYDGAYGAYYGGFWGDDGRFYYYTDATRTKVRQDTAGHFQMNARHGSVIVTARPRIYKMQDEAAAEANAAHAAAAPAPAPAPSAAAAPATPAANAQPQALNANAPATEPEPVSNAEPAAMVAQQ